MIVAVIVPIDAVYIGNGYLHALLVALWQYLIGLWG